MKRFKICKIIFISILGVFLLSALILILCFFVGKPIFRSNLKYWKNNDYSDLPYLEKVNEIMPSFEDDTNYISANFSYHKGCLNPDYADSACCLQLDLVAEDYELAKVKALSKHVFLEEVELKNESLSLANYKIGNYEINLIEIIEEISDKFKPNKFPKKIGIIAYDDTNNRIRYCFIVSESLDYLEDEVAFNNWITRNLNIKW